MAVAKRAGEWTYEDVFDLPEGKRFEITYGELYEMPSPNADQAAIIMNLIARLLPLTTELGGRLYTAPLDVFLPDANPVQPDLLVLLPDRLDLVKRRGVEGAPDIVIEVLSPSDPKRDRVMKKALYARGGVREYWLVSPEAGIIEVMVLEGDVYCLHVRAGDEEPVSSEVLPTLSFPASEVFAD